MGVGGIGNWDWKLTLFFLVFCVVLFFCCVLFFCLFSESLSKRLEEASAKNEKFLNIGDEWTQGNKATFEQGVNQYRGNAREQYCDAIGLTRGFVEMSSLVDLMRAAVNVGLIHSGDAGEHPNLRKKLNMFISYG